MEENKQSYREKELDVAFYNDGYQLAGELLEHSNTPAMLLKAIGQMYAGIESFLDVFVNSAESSGTPAHCAKGCSWCCTQAVFAQTHEFKYLKDWMFKNLSEKEIQEVRVRAKAKREATKDLSKEERLLHKHACPLLKDHVCIAYEARPMACRIYMAYDKASCKYEFEKPEDKSHFPALFEFPLRSGRKMNEGFVARLKELGMDIEEYGLENGILG